MKVVISGSISAYKKMAEVTSVLEARGYTVRMPSLDNIGDELDADGNTVETAHIKIAKDLIREYYEEIKSCDVLLVVNEEKKGISGYIGGNTFLEMGFAHVLGKRLYVLNPYSPQLAYVDEINAMQPVVLYGDFAKLR